MSSNSQDQPGGDQSQSGALIGMAIVMFVLSTIAIVLRFLVRKFVVKSLWWDDWTILLAYLGATIGIAIDFVEVGLDFGHHSDVIKGPTYARFLYYSYGLWIETFATLMWTKISICLFVSRIPATQALKRPLYAAVAILFVSNIVLTLLWILQCSPVEAAWDYTVQGKCFTRDQLLQIILSQGVISAISDFALATYPILLLARVRISLSKKISICLLMGLGVITGAACIVRTVLNWENEASDLSWSSVTNWMWRTLEVKFGIIAACMPTIYPGYQALHAWLKNYRSRSRGLKNSSQSDKTKLWHGGNKIGLETKDANAVSRVSTSDQEMAIPEAAIMKTTEFKVQPENV